MNRKAIMWENVKLPKPVVNKIRKYKEKTGVSIMAFTKKAVLEKLVREKGNVFFLPPRDLNHKKQ